METSKIQSDDLNEFAHAMDPDLFQRKEPNEISVSAGKINLEPDKAQNGLARLVLTLVRLLHELLEKQAIRRMDTGTLSDEEIERLGLTLMKQSEEILRVAKEFNLEEADLNLDLGPLGKLI
ncbi:MAG: gas vesicle protein K [Syntrophobacteraceae bacterium]